VCLAALGWAQDPAPAATPPRRAVQKPAAKPAQKAAQLIIVRNISGTPIAGVRVTISGAARAEATTAADGTASVPLAAGSYRLRFEHDEFFTLEREVTVRNPQAAEIAVVLNRAPPPPEPPPPAPAPAPPPPPPAAGPPVIISIPAFLEKTFVGREPMKESILGCMPDATARLLQLRDPVATHTHADADEVLYIVAGDGAVRLGQDVVAVGPGSMTAIPRGTQHGIERRGRNPLIVLSTLAGTPCASPTTRPDSR
jgi:mannose-6-phosphate isomerase-like protein (cupin superfamily)